SDEYPGSGWEGSGTVKRTFDELWGSLSLELDAIGEGFGEFEGMQIRWVETWMPEYGDLNHRCEGYITVLP
ncbi:MAG: hypothetical protein GWO24_17355, partial [Akkermansiaceae bacterium]|nr:hypothetical protein [Akkermansiaceae bacterium]NIT79299.1 hypothetical protein [Thermoplasmata archaeon]NIY05667.1 hypothetical protein [Thermoplasmata archaeon]